MQLEHHGLTLTKLINWGADMTFESFDFVFKNCGIVFRGSRLGLVRASCHPQKELDLDGYCGRAKRGEKWRAGSAPFGAL